MPKDIVVCSDGTGNEIGTNISNVLKLFRVLEKSDQQRVYYHPGVGTIGLQSTWRRFKQQARGVFGLATGAGLDKDVLAGYRFLCENYQEGDRVFLFGFSRGAYTVRVLAAFIYVMGLLPRDQLDLAGYAFPPTREPVRTLSDPATGRQFRAQGSLAFPPDRRRAAYPDRVHRGLGHGRLHHRAAAGRSRVRYANAAFHADQQQRQEIPARDVDRRAPPDVPAQSLERAAGISVQSVRSCHERDQDIRQVWFAGVHGDVGGGYPEVQSGLSKFPLLWMIEQARAAGLRMDQTMIDHLVWGQPRRAAITAMFPRSDGPDACFAEARVVDSRSSAEAGEMEGMAKAQILPRLLFAAR